MTETEQDDDDPETKARKAKQADLNEHIEALKRERGSRFAQAAAMRTVDDFQSDSEESEEDSDDEPTLNSMLNSNRGRKELANDSDENFDKGIFAENEFGQSTCADAPSSDDYTTHLSGSSLT